MAVVGLPIWTPAVWSDTVWGVGVWRDESTPLGTAVTVLHLTLGAPDSVSLTALGTTGVRLRASAQAATRRGVVVVSPGRMALDMRERTS